VTAEEVSRSLALTSEEGSLGTTVIEERSPEINAAEDSRIDSPTELQSDNCKVHKCISEVQ
jgi:hypothetical protein